MKLAQDVCGVVAAAALSLAVGGLVGLELADRAQISDSPSVTVAGVSTELNEPLAEVETPASDIAYESNIRELLVATNLERARLGIASLQLESRLNQSAQAKADDMTTHEYFAHTNPTTGITGTSTVWDYLPAQECLAAAENLSKITGEYTPQDAIDNLMSSASHRAAILNPQYKTVGFGYNGLYTVQHFCASAR